MTLTHERLEASAEAAKLLVEQNPDDWNCKYIYGLALENLGDVLLRMKREDEGLSTYIRASDVLEVSTAIDRISNVEILKNLFEVTVKTGDLQRDAGDLGGAKSSYSSSLDCISKIFNLENGDLHNCRILVGIYGKLGSTAESMGLFEESIGYLRMGIEVLDDAVLRWPEEAVLFRSLAFLNSQIAPALRRSGQNATASKHEALSLEAIEKSFKLDPDSPEIAEDLCSAREYLAKIEAESGRFSVAVDHCRRLVEVRGHIHEMEPDGEGSQSGLVRALGYLSDLHLYVNDPKSSVECAQRALDLDESEKWILLNLAFGLLFSDKLDESLKIFDDNRGIMVDFDGGSFVWEGLVEENLRQLRSRGVSHPDLEKVAKLLNIDLPPLNVEKDNDASDPE